MPTILSASAPDASVRPARTWNQIMAGYREPSHLRSVLEILVTAAPLAFAWIAMWAALDRGHAWLYLLLIPPAALLLVRLFMIQHDCGHGSFFPRRWANDCLGRAIGAVTLAAYAYSRPPQTAHHATSGNLDRRVLGDMETVTLAHFQRLPVPRRLP